MADGVEISGKDDTRREDKIQRGKRLKKLRLLADLTGTELAKLAGVSRGTVSYWENATGLPLSEQGAVKVINALKPFGIKCSFEWLWYGSGAPPSTKEEATPNEVEEPSLSLFPSIEKEIAIFNKLNPDSVIIRVDTTIYAPTFKFNDILGGKWQPIDSLQSDGYAIVNINNTNQLKWMVYKKNRIQVRTLPNDTQKNNQIEEVEIDRFAPIIRVWRV